MSGWSKGDVTMYAALLFEGDDQEAIITQLFRTMEICPLMLALNREMPNICSVLRYLIIIVDVVLLYE